MRTVVVFLTLTLIASNANAWGDLAHKIIGEIAEQAIKPQTRNYVRGILGVDSIAVAGLWPDLIKDNLSEFSAYHYCSIPTGYTYDQKPEKAVQDARGLILKATEFLKKSRKRNENLIVLRYLIHVVADVHQPLHVGNGYDKGGTACTIKWKPNRSQKSENMSLHFAWDVKIIEIIGAQVSADDDDLEPQSFRDHNIYIQNLKQKYPAWFSDGARSLEAQATVDQWLTESANLRENLYPDDPETMKNVKPGEKYMNRPYCFWFESQIAESKKPDKGIDLKKIPVLGKKYVEKFTPIVEIQLIKAGFRLAFLLDKIADKALRYKSTPRLDDAQQAKILENIQKVFKN